MHVCVTWCYGPQDDKGDVILKYTADEARQLKSSGQLPENGAADGACPRAFRRGCTSPLPLPPSPCAVVINEGVGGGEDGEDGGFDFDDDDGSDDDVDIDAI